MAKRSTPQLIEAGTRFLDLAPWTQLEPDAPFSVHLPGQAQPWYALVIGQGGDDAGCVLTRGNRAQQDMLHVLKRSGDPRELDRISLMPQPWSLLPPDQHRFLKAGELRATGQDPVPHIQVRRPRKESRVPNRSESLLLSQALEQDRLLPRAYDQEDEPRLELHVHLQDGEAHAEVRPGTPRADARSADAKLFLPEHVEEYQQLDETWI